MIRTFRNGYCYFVSVLCLAGRKACISGSQFGLVTVSIYRRYGYFDSSGAAPPFVETGRNYIVSRIQFEAVLNGMTAGCPPAGIKEVAASFGTHIFRAASAGCSRCACVTPVYIDIFSVFLVRYRIFQIICSCCKFFKYRRGIIPICITVRKISQSFWTAEYFGCNFPVQICKCSCNSNFTQRIFSKAVCIIDDPGYCLVIICLSANLNIDCGRKCALQFTDAFCGLRKFRCYIDASFAFEFIQRPVAVIFQHDGIT